ncbi:isochorismatase domain-containing protein 2-like [Copidosoma floridanum]|uniref:isochorismatase domain-containing protein 2-like n=1 Tax=Copidosoma floridanum TaxID=29053 RepID=UPI0006C9C18A|nr:isochorismatase domain-containing protein 2-like [Copidosoma floridanum]
MALNAAKVVLKQGKTALLICDLQDKFAKVIYEFDKIVTNSSKLIQACRILSVPMIATEHNPQALGPTVPQLDITGAKGPFSKLQFSMFTPEVSQELSSLCNSGPPENVVLIGIECHICVENTAIDLIQNGYQVHTVADCCSSRTQEDRLLALERMKQIGCHIATSENVIYKLLKDARHKDFKKILSLVRTPSLSTGLVPTSKM